MDPENQEKIKEDTEVLKKEGMLTDEPFKETLPGAPEITVKPKEYSLEAKYGKRMEKTKKVRVQEVPIEWEGKQEIVLIRKLTFGERAEYSEKFINVHIQGEMESVNVSLKSMQMQALLLGIYKAPFEVSEEYFDNELDGEVGETIYKAIDVFNKLNPSTKKK